jgi:hypothetical protein
MNDFEKRLERQVLRQPPKAWRKEILSAARANIRPGTNEGESSLLAGWRALLARIPLAWGAVAAIWLVIAGANRLMSGQTDIAPSRDSISMRHEAMTVWNLQRAEFDTLANDHIDLLDITPSPKPEVGPSRPRSERRKDCGLGELKPATIKLQTLVLDAGCSQSTDRLRLFQARDHYPS